MLILMMINLFFLPTCTLIWSIIEDWTAVFNNLKILGILPFFFNLTFYLSFLWLKDESKKNSLNHYTHVGMEIKICCKKVSVFTEKFFASFPQNCGQNSPTNQLCWHHSTLSLPQKREEFYKVHSGFPHHFSTGLIRVSSPLFHWSNQGFLPTFPLV